MKPMFPNTVVIPVQLRAGVWQSLYGAFPEFQNDAVAELRVSITALKNPENATRFSFEKDLVLLPANTMLLACMTTKTTAPREAYSFVAEPKPFADVGCDHFFIPFTLEETLNLRLRGTKKAQLLPCRSKVPFLPDCVDSVNQAYTRISEKYEGWRKSHTGDVFTKVYLAEPQGQQIISLEVLREAAQNKLVQELHHRSGQLL